MERLMLITLRAVWTKNKNAGSDDRADKDLLSLLQNDCICAGFVLREDIRALAVTTTRPLVLAVLQQIKGHIRKIDPDAEFLIGDVNPL